MNIIIVGVGKVGCTIAKYLSLEEDNVTVIDKKADALNRINDKLDIMCIKGNCTSLKVLQEAGIEDADLLIAVTDSDELNMLTSLAAKKLGCKYTIARVRDPGYDEDITLLTESIGIDLVINPEKAAAIEISKLIKYPSIGSVDDFANRRVNLVGIDVSRIDSLAGKKVSEIESIRGNLLICGVEREDEFIIPNGDTIFCMEDRIYVIGAHRDIVNFFKSLGKYKKKIKTAMIIGGGKISYYLAKIISDIGVNCKIIERKYEKCQELTELLPDSVIISGDGMDEDLLLSESLSAADTFITLTDRDEDNLIASLFAYKLNVPNIITKITRDNYTDIAKTIGINSTISPKIVTANKIIKYVRSIKGSRESAIENIYRICNNKAEAIEFIADENTYNLGKCFKNIDFIDGCIVAIIVRDKEVIIPTGDTFIKEQDRVVVVNSGAKPLYLNDIFLEREE